MTTDLYAKCPCGSGKKIKFCCKDIISDIERIERMLRGEQRTAALEKINKLLEKHPDRSALLCLKAQVLLELQNIEEAERVVDRLLEVEPDNPSALAMKATTVVASGDLPAGLALLHRALRLCDGVLSKMVYRSYISICLHLIQRAEYIAAYAHLLTMVSITRGEERTSVSMLMNLASSEKLPAIFQGLLISDACPENVTWRREFEVALDSYRHGDWSACVQLLDDMSKRILDEPVLLRNKGILQAWTCQPEAAVRSFRDFAAIRSVDLREAVEAEACAQVLDPVERADQYELVAVSHEVDNADAILEKLLSADTVESVPVQHVPGSDTPPPKGQFVVFDRPVRDLGSQDAESLQVDDLPREICSVTLRGKETDQNSRLIVFLIKDDNFAERIQQVGQIIGEEIQEQGDVVGHIHQVEHMFRPNVVIPPTASIEQHRELQRQWLERQLRQVWPNLRFRHFGDQSAKEAATQRKYQRAVLGAILNLEMWMDRQPFPFDFNQLRADLGLPINEPIDPNETNIRTLSPSKLLSLQIEKLSDADLKFMFEFLSVRPNGKLLYNLGKQILARESMAKNVDLIEVYERLADLAPTTDETLEYLGQARDLAVSAGESPATWLVSELDVRIQRGESEIANRLLSEIQTRYIREPGVPNVLAAVLGKYGLLPATAGGRAAAEPLPAASAPAAVSGIWTPESGDSASDGGTSEGTSKLWVPGMD